MIVILKKGYSEQQLNQLQDKVKEYDLEPRIWVGTEKTVVGLIGDTHLIDRDTILSYPFVDKILSVSSPYKLTSRDFHPGNTVIKFKNGVKIGAGNNFTVIAGPCALESEKQVLKIAEIVKKQGVNILRAALYKPRTSPYAFQGIGKEGLKIMQKVKDETGLLTETEVMDVRDVKETAEVVDVLRVGTRNMQNFDLLKEVGKVKNPVVLKRGLAATIEEWLLSAEYIMNEGNPNVILCERGLRTFESSVRNMLDISAIPVVKEKSHLPIIVDPSHSTGNPNYIPSISLASLAAGADGLLVDVHYAPEEALVDGKQALTPDKFEELLKQLRKVAEPLGKTV